VMTEILWKASMLIASAGVPSGCASVPDHQDLELFSFWKNEMITVAGGLYEDKSQQVSGTEKGGAVRLDGM